MMTYRALYDFTSDHKNILCFNTGDLFTQIYKDFHGTQDHQSNHKGWIYVANEHLKHGYVPATYVSICEDNDEEAVRFRQSLISKCEVAKRVASNEKELRRYEKLLRQIQGSFKPSDPTLDNLANGSTDNQQPQYNDADEDAASLTPVSHQPTPDIALPKDPEVGSSSDSTYYVIPDLFGCELLEHVKHDSGLGYKQVRLAVESTLEFLRQHLPAFKSASDAILQSIKGSSPSGEALENIHDWQRLGCIFTSILQVKTDVEQLNWALYEDQHIISEFLEELNSILTDGDPVVCKLFLQKDQYNNVEALVQYFQMETRANILQLLLKVFVALCSLDRQCILVLVNTDLPLLLARDILSDRDDASKFIHSCDVLTMLLWTGEGMPVNHYDILNMDFVNYLLEVMDDLTSSDDTEKITNSGTELILAFNLQFTQLSTNTVIQALKSRHTAKEFLEKLIMLANREDDPVGVIFDHAQPPPNSVHKMLLDIFSQRETADLFYTNDLKVLIEIIARKLMDLSPDDEAQPVYLRLANNVICNTDYIDHRHCVDEFHDCFQKLLTEDSGCFAESRALVTAIIEKFPQLFDNVNGVKN